MPDRLAPLLFASGCAGLTYEVLWMRRLALLSGSGSVAVTLTVAVFFGALGAGGLLALRWRPRRPLRAYALLELAVAVWAVLLPFWLGALAPRVVAEPGLRPVVAIAVLLLGPPALALGATLPVIAGLGLTPARVSRLYAWNTAGAVLGVLATPALLLPLLGVRGSELAAACLTAGVAAVAWRLTPPGAPDSAAPGPAGPLRWGPIAAAACAGGVAMSLEVSWTRLAALLLGASIHAFAWVLAVFLAGVALGAAWGARPGSIRHPLGALGALAVLGTWTFSEAPVWLAWGYDLVGPGWTGLLQALLAAVAMAGAPVASGMVFARCLARVGGSAASGTAAIVGANTLAGVLGAGGTGLWLLQTAGLPGAVYVAGGLAAVGAACAGRPAWLVAVVGITWLAPDWNAKLHAVGIHQRVSDLGDRSRQGVLSFADDGWELLRYEQGRTAAVAVGRSLRTGNTWLSINGKVDASTGADMPTQLLSGQLPARIAAGRERALVVGLASGVTAGALLAEGIGALDVVEIEPAVVRASRAFDGVSGAPLDDVRTTLFLDDARAVLQRPGPLYDVIVSEPSNPWITGVSNLFTREYWALGRARLAPGGAFCQWIQLYGLEHRDLRILVRTFTDVFGDAWLYETVPGADVLLIAGPQPPASLPLAATLGPAGLLTLSRGVPLNTDDRPWVELSAPRSVHLATAQANEAALRRLQRDESAAP